MTHPISEKKLDRVQTLLWRIEERCHTETRVHLLELVHEALAAFASDHASDNGENLARREVTQREAETAGQVMQDWRTEHQLTKKVDELEAALWRIVGIGEDDDSDAEEAWQAAFDIARTALNDTTQCRESDNG